MALSSSGIGGVKVTVNPKGQVVAAVGGPSPGARDNPGESYPNKNPLPTWYTPRDSPPTPGGGGGGGGGDGGGGPSGPTDWSNLLGIYGLPTDVQNEVNRIFASTTDVNQATALALAYIRGTDWYKQTYPGIQEGIAKGVIGNEADYRAYVNQLQQMNKQYYGTDITSQQIADYLKAGYSTGHVGQLFQGDAWVRANGQQANYLVGNFSDRGQLNQGELQSLGQENAGLDSAMGQKFQNMLGQAQQRMSRIFNGTLANPSLSVANSGGIQATNLGRQPDVAA